MNPQNEAKSIRNQGSILEELKKTHKRVKLLRGYVGECLPVDATMSRWETCIEIDGGHAEQ